MIGDLIDDTDLRELGRNLAEQWSRSDDDLVRDVVSMADATLDPALAAQLARLLIVAVRLERCFLAMLSGAEAKLRTSLGYAPFEGTLDQHHVDRLYPSHPRRVLCELLNVDVETSQIVAAIRSGGVRRVL